MVKYMINHEEYILAEIDKGDFGQPLQRYHQKQIAYLQHERLIHLLVMMLVSIIFIGLFMFMMVQFSISLLVLNLILLVLDCFYIHHYYILENTVQRWYTIDNLMDHYLSDISMNIYKLNKK